MDSPVPAVIIRLIEYAALFGVLAGVPLFVLLLAKSRRPAGYVAAGALLITLGFAYWRELLNPPPPPPAPEPPKVEAPPPLTIKKMGPVAEPAPPPPPPPEPVPEPVPVAAPEPEPAKATVKKCSHEVVTSKLAPFTKRLELKVCGADVKAARETLLGEAFANAQRGAKKEDFLKFKARWKETIAEAVSDTVKMDNPETGPRGTTLSGYVAVDDFSLQLRALGFSDRDVQPSFKFENEKDLMIVSTSELEQIILDRLRKQSNYSLSGGLFADPKLIKDELRNLDVIHKQVRYILDVTDLLDVGTGGNSEEVLYVLRVRLGASD